LPSPSYIHTYKHIHHSTGPPITYTVASTERKKKSKKPKEIKKNLCRRHHTTAQLNNAFYNIIYRFGTNRLSASGSHGCPTRVLIHIYADGYPVKYTARNVIVDVTVRGFGPRLFVSQIIISTAGPRQQNNNDYDDDDDEEDDDDRCCTRI